MVMIWYKTKSLVAEVTPDVMKIRPTRQSLLFKLAFIAI